MGLFDNSRAFAPLYSDEVMVRGATEARRHIAAALKCCVFDVGFADPCADDGTESDVRKVEITFPISAWPFTEPPQTGDLAEFDGASFAVSSVSRRLGDWCLTARQTKGGAA